MATYYEQKQNGLTSGAIILCQHGYLGNKNTFNGFFNSLGNLGSAANAVRLNNAFTKNYGSADSELTTICQNSSNNGKNIFIKTEFSNNIGRVAEQVGELNSMIVRIKQITNLPIILLGHSKGGLVNMQYAVTYPGSVTKLISCGTPYNMSVMGFMQSVLDDITSIASNLIKDPAISLALSIASNLLDQFVSDEDLGSFAFYNQLKSKWNALSNKPVLTTIAASQIGFQNDPATGGDLVVCVSSQHANGYNGVRARELVSENFEYILHTSLKKQIEIRINLVEQIKDIGNGIASGDALVILLGFILAFFVPNNKDPRSYDLIHTKELSNKRVCYEILAGIGRTSGSTQPSDIRINYYK